jgi:steroid 5-alpha reductase family enzyme
MWPEFLHLWLAALLFAMVLMALIWRLAIRIGNAGIVDIAWSAGFAPVVIFYAAAASGALPRRALIALMVSLWSLRLGAYLYVRVRSHHPLEDRRYAQLRRDWGAHVERRMFGFFQLQAALLALLSVPWLLTCLNPRSGLHPLEWVGGLLWLIAIAGEALADRQLQRFKAEPANRGTVCQLGLWRYSRHPN